MKKMILIGLLFCLFGLTQANAQRIFSPQLQGFNGIGNVFYPNGFYQGQLSNGVAQGAGTYYFRDGTIFRGWFLDGWRNGPGVVIAPFQGYLPSCWNMGNFIGQQCPSLDTGQRNYTSNIEVREVIHDSYNDFPDSEADFVASNPDNYEIVKISSNTQLGRTLLGKYSGN